MFLLIYFVSSAPFYRFIIRQECLDCTFSWFRGLATFPLLPVAQEVEDEEDEGLDEIMKETAKEKEERKSDHDVARQDIIKVNKLRSFLEIVFVVPTVPLNKTE